MKLQGLGIACIRGWGERMCHAPIIPQQRGETQRVRPDTHPPPAHHLRLAHTLQWTAQRTALSPMTVHRNVEARNLWIVQHPIVACCLPCATPKGADIPGCGVQQACGCFLHAKGMRENVFGCA